MGVCGSEDAASLVRIHGHSLAVAALIKCSTGSGAGFPEALADAVSALAVRMLTENRHRTAITKMSSGKGSLSGPLLLLLPLAADSEQVNVVVVVPLLLSRQLTSGTSSRSCSSGGSGSCRG
jgi:hypothetical protein